MRAIRGGTGVAMGRGLSLEKGVPMRVSVRSLFTWSALAALTACSSGRVDPGSLSPDAGAHAAAHALEEEDEYDCHDPVSRPETLTAPPDEGTLVRHVRDLATRNEPFDPAALPIDDSIRVRVDLGEEDLRSVREGTYAEVVLDDVTVAIVNRGSPRTPPTSARLVLDVGARDLLGLPLIASYRPDAAGGFDLTIAAEEDDTGGGPGVPLGPGSLQVAPGCITDAFSLLVGHLPNDMPPVQFPDITGNCTDYARCVELRRAHAHAHVETFWANLMVEYVASLGSADREFTWRAQGRTVIDSLTGYEVSPWWWFGEYDSHWFSRIHGIVNDLWGVFRTGEHGSHTMEHRCPPQTLEPTNLCYTAHPSAHHYWRGEINFCPGWFDRDFSNQVRLVIHENGHHLFTEGLALIDRQTHGHGNYCTHTIETDTIYGAEEVHHLATYIAQNGKECLHRDIATRTTDAYAQMIHHFGGAVVSGWMVAWPVPGETPHGPDCNIDPGTENGCCLPADFENAPDGDWAGQYCPDDEGETTCVRTTFNAAETLGVCTRCDLPGENQKPAGCECFGENDCALGLTCYGYDTHGGGGVGHCFSTDGPPDWACAADCKRLFNDEQAICAHDYPGGAHCFPLGCDEAPEYMECPTNGDGVCHYECDPNDQNCELECGAECLDAQDCWDLGYPPGFLCIGAVCRFPT